MNYEKIYNALVEKAKVRGLDKSQHEGYFEIHHILPKCLGGTDDKENLVMFTAREHFVAHLILWKLNRTSKELALSVHLMNGKRGNNKNSRLYENLRIDRSKGMSKENSANYVDLTGNKYSRLLVTGLDSWQPTNSGSFLSKWACLCDCGNITAVVGGSLKSGLTTSCGCYKSEMVSLRSRKYQFSAKILQLWKNMMGRCYNEKDASFKSVGAKGIQVCEEWFDKQTFADFVVEVHEGMVFGRIDFSKDFEPSNCKFMTRTEYQGNFPKLTTNKTGRTGVYLDKKTGMWYTQMTYGQKTKRLSKANLTFEEAVKVREEAELAYFGRIKE